MTIGSKAGMDNGSGTSTKAPAENADALLKREVQAYWDAHPCGTQFTDLEWGSREFFEQVEKFRYDVQPFMQRMIRFDAYKGKRLLEIGCGLGTDLLQFARAGAQVTGIDLTPAGVDLARKRFSLYGIPADLQVADAENLPFPDGTFEVVYSFGVLHHTPDTQKAIDEAYRVLKPGGEIILMLYHKHSWHVLAGVPFMAITRWLRNKSVSMSVMEDWIRIYDGAGNPLGKAYSRSEVRRMTRQFRTLHFELCDPVRRRFPGIFNWFNQNALAPFLGFYLIVRGVK